MIKDQVLGCFYFPDFVLGNKIIEYDGIYWHNDEKDAIRNLVYKNNGYELLIINESDFSRKKKNPETIKKCLHFIRDEN